MSIKKHLFLFCFTLCLTTVNVFSQQINIINTESKKPIPDVFIYNKNQSLNTLSDSSGLADISNFAKRDTLIFTHPNFTTFAIPKLNIGNSIYLKEKHITLEAFEVSETKPKEKALVIAAKIDKISRKEVSFYNPQTAADMLELSGGVYIQKSQMGGGSPIIRGFEANRVLLVVDGVRMNNAIYRSGHLQNAITIDNSIIEKTDIIYGPNSVIYGSDAIGGVVHYKTIVPKFASDSANTYKANAYTRYSSANNETTGHIDFNLGFKKIALLTSITHSNFDDLKMGATPNPKYPKFGIEKYYAGRINNTDTMLTKEDKLLQIGTGYSQTDVLQKISYKLSDNVLINLNAQYSTSSDVPRYDQLTDYKNGELKFAEWNYGPQNRLLTSLSAQIKDETKLFNQAEIIFSYQKVDEDRISRRFKNDNRIKREEDVIIYGFNADFLKNITSTKEIFYGIEATHNDVQSSAFATNILTNEISNAATRYPDGGSTLSNLAAYLSFKNNFSEKATYSLGLRYSYAMLKASFIDTSFIKLPFSDINNNNGGVTGNFGFVYHPNKKWNLQFAFASGYRNPNIDDIGKVFSKNDYVLVPNKDLKPEYAYSGEVGITRAILENRIKINAVGYYTLLKDAIVRKEFNINNFDSLNYEGETLKVQANINADEAIVYGFSGNILATINKEFSVKSSINYTLGEIKTDTVPLAHIPPLYGRTDFILNAEPLTVSVYAKYQAWKNIEEFSTNGEDNEDKATKDGSPAWFTFNINAAVEIGKHFTAQVALENLLDSHYRTFASGVSAPGRNFILTLRGSF